MREDSGRYVVEPVRDPREDGIIQMPPIGYVYTIFTSPRCTGLVSRRKYSTRKGAIEAAERMLRKLGIRGWQDQSEVRE